ncbi:Elongator complex protein 4 [Acipenser ruthenus]|uniref:Elongator complex protein 4 n=1 Tax=Acipenser ruthenus TaxID=7906 RepID=A0A444U120_ACIRT|nr:Elongator complex protein 4 [Acipenser ruthenus]
MAIPIRTTTRAGVNVNTSTRANATSFQKKSRSKLVSIPGTRPSVQNGQLLVSTGELLAPLLDEISNTEVEKELGKAGDSSTETQDSMKIAWRYQNLPKVQTTLASSSRFGHYCDVSKSMSTDMCEAATCHSFFLPNELPLESATESSNMNMGYIKLLRSIQGVIHKEGFDGAGPQGVQRPKLRYLWLQLRLAIGHKWDSNRMTQHALQATVLFTGSLFNGADTRNILFVS